MSHDALFAHAIEEVKSRSLPLSERLKTVPMSLNLVVTGWIFFWSYRVLTGRDIEIGLVITTIITTMATAALARSFSATGSLVRCCEGR